MSVFKVWVDLWRAFQTAILTALAKQPAFLSTEELGKGLGPDKSGQKAVSTVCNVKQQTSDFARCRDRLKTIYGKPGVRLIHR